MSSAGGRDDGWDPSGCRAEDRRISTDGRSAAIDEDASSRIPGGCLIAVEGIDGVGKTTVASRVVDHLRAQGRAVHRTRCPSDGPIGREIRRALSGECGAPDLSCREATAALFAADLYDQARREILPSLDDGRIVVVDRWWSSSVAYQAGSDDSLASFVRSVNRRAPLADLTLYLRADPGVAARRRAARSGGAQVFDGRRDQAEAALAYDAMFLRPDSVTSGIASDRVAVLDGSQDEDLVVASAVGSVVGFLVLAGYLREVAVDVSRGAEVDSRAFVSRGHAARSVSAESGVSERDVRYAISRGQSIVSRDGVRFRFRSPGSP